MIHSTAVIDAGAELDPDVRVGPYSIIEAGVEIGAGTEIGPHCVIRSGTRLGRDNRVLQFCSVGEAPQDIKYQGEPTRLEIGDRNIIREYVSLHRGTAAGVGVTRVGDDNLLMAYVHIAHDCRIGNRTVLANCTSMGGHVLIDDCAILGGFTIVHQFCRLGAYCFTGMGSAVSRDVPPFVTVSGYPARPFCINSVGLKRRGFSATTIATLRRAYKVLYRQGLGRAQALGRLEEMAVDSPEVAMLAGFLAESSRGIVR